MAVDRSATKTQKSRKAKALLAGGLVLGVGAAVTLAAWTDQEWATGTFAAGTFNIEGSTDGLVWADHETSGTAAALTFEANADNLTPGDTVASAFALRTDATTTYSATVDLITGDATGANSANLSYGIFTVDSIAACQDTTVVGTGTTIVSNGATFGSTAPSATTFDLAAGASGVAGAATFLCFQVTAGPDLVEGAGATATWTLEATSKDS